MTQYIITHNYHNGFKKSVFIERHNTSDSTLINFIVIKNISGIHISGKIDFATEDDKKLFEEKGNSKYRDSIIEYSFGFVPIFGKRKELHFDFSSSPPTETYKKKGVKQVILEKGIYYIEY